MIRHAVSIDERRAKFRQDLISETKPAHVEGEREHDHDHDHEDKRGREQDRVHKDQFGASLDLPGKSGAPGSAIKPQHKPHLHRLEELRREHSPMSRLARVDEGDGHSMNTVSSNLSNQLHRPHTHFSDDDDDDADEAIPQDIQEIWFPGCHAVRRRSH
jgi:hypothetical protein